MSLDNCISMQVCGFVHSSQEYTVVQWVYSVNSRLTTTLSTQNFWEPRTILTQADQVTHATRDSLSLRSFGSFIVTSTRTKNQSVCKGQKHHKFSDTVRKQIALRVWVALGLRNETIETNTFISSPEKHQFADIQVPLEWIINCKKDDSDTFHSSRKHSLLFIAKFTSVFYPR